MASVMATKRLRKEYLALQRKPVENIEAVPLDSNILEWHYVISGTEGTPYEGGYYHGILRFPPEYPMKPPAVLMTTPNGRFKTNQRLCLSMSDFHPETWNPMWSVSSILTGLYSFMKRKYAATSLETNCGNPTFRKLFPELVELQQKREEEQRMNAPSTGTLSSTNSSSSTGGSGAANGASSIEKSIFEDWTTSVSVAAGAFVFAILLLYWFS